MTKPAWSSSARHPLRKTLASGSCSCGAQRSARAARLAFRSQQGRECSIGDVGKTAEPLEAGRSALQRHAWPEALALLKQSAAADTLDAAGLEILADAAWWMAQPADSLAARERA